MSEAELEARTLRRNVRELPAAAWWLVGGMFVNYFGAFVPMYLILFLPRDRGFTTAGASLAVGAYGLGELAAGPVGGSLADRLGRRTTIVLTTLAAAACTMGLYAVHSRSAIIVAAFLTGFATEAFRPAASALMTDLVPERQRVTAFALMRFAGNLAFGIGGAVAGVLADRSYLWVFVMNATSLLAFALLAAVALPRVPPPGAIADGGGSRDGDGYGHALRDRVLVVFLVAWALTAFVYAQQQAALPLQVVARGLPKRDFGLLLLANGLLVAVLELPISSWTMRRPARTMNALAFLLVGVGFALTGLAARTPAFLLTVVVWTAGEMVGAPVGSAFVAGLAPDRLRGRYLGLYQLAGGIGMVAGPTLGVLLWSHGHALLWEVSGAVGVVAALLALAARGPRDAREQQAAGAKERVRSATPAVEPVPFEPYLVAGGVPDPDPDPPPDPGAESSARPGEPGGRADRFVGLPAPRRRGGRHRRR